MAVGSICGTRLEIQICHMQGYSTLPALQFLQLCGQAFCKLSLNWELADVLLMTGLWIQKRKITELISSHHIVSGGVSAGVSWGGARRIRTDKICKCFCTTWTLKFCQPYCGGALKMTRDPLSALDYLILVTQSLEGCSSQAEAKLCPTSIWVPGLLSFTTETNVGRRQWSKILRKNFNAKEKFELLHRD